MKQNHKRSGIIITIVITVIVLLYFLIVMMLSFFFDYGPLPAVATGVIWLVTAISYFREAQKLGREKINNQ